jgi:SPP1 family predicted phage head-tail adaptor
MRAGQLRDKVTIQKITYSQDSYGGVTEAWSTHAAVWARVEYLTGSELFKAQQVNAQVKGRIRIRRRSDIEANMRVLFGSVYLEILAVYPADNMGRETEILFGEWTD